MLLLAFFYLTLLYYLFYLNVFLFIYFFVVVVGRGLRCGFCFLFFLFAGGSGVLLGGCFVCDVCLFDILSTMFLCIACVG